MRHDEILGLLHYLLAPGQEPTLSWAGRWELAFWALALLLTGVLAALRPQWMLRAEDAFRRISLHRRACVWSVGGAVLAVRLLLLPLIPVPVPVILDEYSYLLGADTFASARPTNPPHPMWVHFETFNVNMQPTYQSMYPPAQGLLLGLAQRLTGEPWIGVLLSVAVMCSVFTWMLQGWMAPQWALLGGLFSVVRYGIFSYWTNGYWGGAIAAIGGALLLGALPRLRRRLRWQHGIVFAIGLAILANSRPFEGFLFALPLSIAFAWLVLRGSGDAGMPGRRVLAQIVLPCLLLLGVVASWMLYYNWRGTGNALQMPYTLNQDTYHISRPFLFQKPYPIPRYRNRQMRTFYMFHEYPDLLRSRSAWGLQFLMGQKFFCYYVFLLWPLLLLFIPGVILAARSPELRIVVYSLGLLLLGLTMQLWPAHGHYAAPAAGAVLLVLLHALQRLRNGKGGPLKPSEGGPHPPSVGECGEGAARFPGAPFKPAVGLSGIVDIAPAFDFDFRCHPDPERSEGPQPSFDLVRGSKLSNQQSVLPSIADFGEKMGAPSPSVRLNWHGKMRQFCTLFSRVWFNRVWFSRVWFSRAMVLCLFLAMLLPIADRLWNPYAFEDHGIAVPRQIDRERIRSQLSRTPGEHLVIVHYQQRDVPSVEWVYNRADIDHAKVVWARDMGPEANQELLRYFASRRIWYVDRNSGSLLVPYTYTSATGSCHPANGLPPACGMFAELPALR